MSIFSSKTILGTVPSPLTVEDPFHIRNLRHVITRRDCLFFQLFLSRRSATAANRGTGDANHTSAAAPADDVFKVFNNSKFEQPLVVHSLLLEKSLKDCGNTLRVLGLSFCYSVNEDVIKVIAENCKCIEYLDLSFSSPVSCHKQTRDYKTEPEDNLFSPVSAETWKSLAASIGSTLTHLNLICYMGINDNGLTEMLRNCPNLEEIQLSIAPFWLLKGQSLSEAGNSLKGVTLFCDEKKDGSNVGHSALAALARSNAKCSIEVLRIRRCLTNEMLSLVASEFSHIKTFDIVECTSKSLNFAKISECVVALKELESLSVHVPEEYEFSNDLTKITKSCAKLKALAVFGGIIHDEALKQISINVPNLQYLALSHLMFGISLMYEHRFTDTGFKSLAKLKNLRHLKINQAAITNRGVNEFLVAFKGDINQLKSLDFRECPKVTVKTLKLCLEKSTLRGPGVPPLAIYIMGTQFKVNEPIEVPQTALVAKQWWVNYPGFWNEYFTPYVNASLLSESCEKFVENCLQYIGGHFVHKEFTKLRRFVLKAPPCE